jgi:hypothetical protein
LFKLQDGEWICYSRIPRNNNRLAFSMVGQASEPPSIMYRASIYQKGDKLICEGYGKIATITTSQSYNSFCEYRNSLPAGEKWCF